MKGQQSKFKKQHEGRQGNTELATGSTILNDKYVLAQLIGRGSFGQVFRGVSTLNNKQTDLVKFPKYVGVKVQNDLTKASQIANQITVINAVNKHHRILQGFPQLYASGIESGHAFIIMDLLGPNLQDLMTLCGGKFTLKTSLLLIIQILQRTQVIHQVGYVYRDIKPQNFLMGLGRRSKQVFMVDFGLCKRYRDQNTKLFLPYRQAISMVGTIRYSSINSHLGIDQTRRDDLESIIYLLIYFLKGELPWQGLAFEHKFEKDHMIMDCKLKITAADLCKELPQQIINVFEYVKSLDFYQDPDYRYIISELTYIFEDKCDLVDLQYDWQKLPQDARLDKTNIEISFPSNLQSQDNVENGDLLYADNKQNQPELPSPNRVGFSPHRASAFARR